MKLTFCLSCLYIAYLTFTRDAREKPGISGMLLHALPFEGFQGSTV